MALAMHVAPISWYIVTPVIADKTCPPTRLRGCASGLFIAAYKSTAEAPNEPMISVRSRGSKNLELRKAPAAIPKKLPRQDQNISVNPTPGGLLAPPFILNRYCFIFSL